MKKAEKAHLKRVAEMGCIACERINYFDTPSEIHHIRTGMGMGQRNDHYHVIPLCPNHHRHLPNAIHQSKRKFEAHFGTEVELLNIIRGRL
ncbi:Ref family recombination enhancement nuclease [Glaciecola siphonariae]|uniref:Ref family recombination enhancement nuclease n=1 Tax=Glaciecola siphonariae TaxID=521012 RepID=A0ABV9LS87_9ALTE